MKDRRFVDELDTEELERILLLKRREARLARLRQRDLLDRVKGRDPLEPAPPSSLQPPIPTAHRQFQGTGASSAYHSVEIEDRQKSALWLWCVHWLSAPLRINWRFIANRILLIVEITAVLGLIVIVVDTWQNREKISQDVQEVFVPPTPEPTTAPLVNAVVLPGGHTAPDARGFSVPEPVPQHLQAQAQAITPQPIPTRGSEHALRIVIPSIGVDHPIVEGDSWEPLKQGVGHTPWSANPGEEGNCVLTAYNDIFGGIFRRLPEMELGDEINVHTGSRTHRYVVKATHVVEPTQVDLMNPTAQPTLTLISSYPYLQDDQRVVVIAGLDQTDTKFD
jgi:sortase A